MVQDDGEGSGDELERLRDQIDELRRDNDRLRATETIAQKAQADLLALIENTEDFVLLSDAQAKPVVFNEKYASAMRELLGIEMRAGFQPHTLLPEEGRAYWDRLHRRVLSGERFKAEYEHEHEGETRYFEISYNPVFRNDEVIGFCEYTRDITERKLVEEKLISDRDLSERSFQLLFDTMLDGFAVHEIITDDDGRPIDYRFLAVNPAFERLTGLDRDAVVGRTVREVIPAIEERWIETYGQVALTGEPARFEDFQGTLNRHYEVYAFAPQAGQFACVFQDITARRTLDQERRRAERLESVGLLAGGIAHDFNNILQSLLVSVQVARGLSEPGGPAMRTLEEAERACARASQLTKQLITFARGGQPVKNRVVLDEAVREWVEFALRGSNVRHDVSISEGLWPVEVDVGQISQVVHNLVANAEQAMPDGGTVSVRVENAVVAGDAGPDGEPAAQTRVVRIVVTDTGSGIADEVLARVFDPYFTTKDAGTGLGLATSYSIIRDHAGTITVDSTVGEGSTFELRLPALDGAAPSREQPTSDLPRGAGNILLMDDDAQLRRVTGSLLEGLGYQVSTVADGKDAVEVFAAATRPFDAVIIDLTVPGGMGGLETVQRLRELDPGVRAIVSSGYSSDPVMARYHEHGFCAVLAKPYRVQELAELVFRVVRGAAATSESA